MKPITGSRLFTFSAMLVAARIAGAGLTFLTQIMIARWLGADTLGTYAIAMSFAGVLTIFAVTGFPSIAMRYLSAYRVEGRDDLIAGFLKASRRQLLIGACALIALSWAALALFGGTMAGDLRLALAIGAVMTVFMGALMLNGGIANAYRRPFLGFLPDTILRPVLVIVAFSALIAALGHEVTAATLMGVNLALIAGAAAVQIVLMRRRGIAASGTERTVESRSEWQRAALPMILLVLFTNYFADVDVLILGMLMPPEDVAVFNICFRFTAFIGFALKAIYQIVLPDLAEAHVREDRKGVTRAIGRANLIAVGMAVAATLTLALVGRHVLAIVGPEFVPGYGLLIVLGLSQIATAALGPNVQLMTVTGHQMRAVPAFVAGFAILVVLNLVLVPPFGLIGAGWAMVSAVMCWSVWLAVSARRLTGYEITLLALLPSRDRADAI
ncbi:oligosaccharide flippase family protein [Kaustia mangrovi]|uniref:Oligosaccharide flippase family protein n=1 Tax=Kaustia mangrovi TaxID=2593653 RepID=A0A7S8C4F2_9HYPH|nr:oligosaccharide flippase family protein [Kaustia mangrovi]QPC43194.1 oligosaccharide flippase family protein [Kaustia mangrovi]